MSTNNRFELVDSKSHEGFDLFLLMSISFLIPADLRHDIRKIIIHKYTVDGVFIHSPQFMKDPVVGVQIIIEKQDGKKQQMFALAKGERAHLDRLSGWSIEKCSDFSAVMKAENVFNVDIFE